MKILVTGAKGQVGSAFCRLASKHSMEVVGLDSREMDITNPAAIDAALDHFLPDFLVNTAAYTAVDKAEQEPDKVNLVNGIAPGYLAQAAIRRSIPMVHISTDYVFNGRKRAHPYVETDPVGPLGVYGQSKLQGEQRVMACLHKYIILRTSWVFGLEGVNFPKTILRLAKERPEIGIVADQFGCPTFADDIALAVLAMAGSYRQTSSLPWGLYHYSGKEACSWYDFAAYLLQEARAGGLIQSRPLLKGLTTAEYPTRAERPANSTLDCSKFQAYFPEIPLSDWRKGVKLLLDSLKSTINPV